MRRNCALNNVYTRRNRVKGKRESSLLSHYFKGLNGVQKSENEFTLHFQLPTSLPRLHLHNIKHGWLIQMVGLAWLWVFWMLEFHLVLGFVSSYRRSCLIHSIRWCRLSPESRWQSHFFLHLIERVKKVSICQWSERNFPHDWMPILWSFPPFKISNAKNTTIIHRRGTEGMSFSFWKWLCT
jgi:hypothetical protein